MPVKVVKFPRGVTMRSPLLDAIQGTDLLTQALRAFVRAGLIQEEGLSATDRAILHGGKPKMKFYEGQILPRGTRVFAGRMTRAGNVIPLKPRIKRKY